MVLIAWVMSLAIVPARAEITKADIDAVTQVLNFAQSLPTRQTIALVVIYRAGDNEARGNATRAAQLFSEQTAPGGSTYDIGVVSTADLAQHTKRTDLVYVIPPIGDSGKTISDFIRRQHSLGISSDPSCLSSHSCVLLIQSGQGNITLDTELARDIGANFSAVFTMMVKRR